MIIFRKKISTRVAKKDADNKSSIEVSDCELEHVMDLTSRKHSTPTAFVRPIYFFSSTQRSSKKNISVHVVYFFINDGQIISLLNLLFLDDSIHTRAN